MWSSQRPRAGEWAVTSRKWSHNIISLQNIFRSYGRDSTIVSGICLTELENSPIAQLVSRILDDNLFEYVSAVLYCQLQTDSSTWP